MTLNSTQGALLWVERWNVDCQDDMESSVLRSVCEFIFLTREDEAMDYSEMMMVKQLW